MPTLPDTSADDTFDAGTRDYHDAAQAAGWRRWAARARRWRGRQAWTAPVHRRSSEILFLESVQIAIQRGWPVFAQSLLDARRCAHRDATADVRASAVAAQESGAVCAQLEKLHHHAAEVVANADGAARAGPVADSAGLRQEATAMLGDFAEAATGLPATLREAIDAALEQMHRRFMVLGKAAVDDLASWPPQPIQDEPVHPQALVGLALSGGGIRSASFAAGALEALARQGLLRAFDIVSSVSGGGYAAAWIGAWAYRHADGMAGVEADLRPVDGLARAPLRWLRRHCAYLAPRRGSSVASDLWALIAAYLTRWLPILLLVTAWLVALLLLPHVIVAASKSVARQEPALRTLWAQSGLALTTVLAVLLMGLLRRLTMYHRVPTDIPRPSPGLAQLVMLSTVGVTLLIAACLSLLQDAALLALPTVLPGGLAAAVALVCAVAIGLSSLVAAPLARPGVQQALDRFRIRRLRQQLPAPGPLVRHAIPPSRRMLATLCGLAVSSWCLTWLLQSSLHSDLELHALFTLGPPAILASYGLAEMASMALIAPHLRERDRAWAARVAGWMLAGVVASTLLFGLALWPDPVDLLRQHPQVLLALVLASLVLAATLWRFAGFAAVANAALALLVLWLLALGVVGPMVRRFPADEGLGIVALMGGVALFAFVLGQLLDVNRFTLHSIYKEGLVRTFLGASRLSLRHPQVRAPADMPAEEQAQFRPRRADPATNIDEDDDLALAWLRSRPDRPLPLFLFNAAVSGRNASDLDGRVPREWPFTFSPYFCGGAAEDIGFADTRAFFADATDPGERTGISLGTAMAVSGAAMSPVSGRLTQPVTAFLKALMNARLGLWLGNPTDAHAVRSRRPSPGGTTLLREMIGVRTRFQRWLHLSDGGHFENLGLHELLRRGCRRIVVVDSSCDPRHHLSDLAEAFRRARIDLGVHVHRTQPWAGIGPDALAQPWAWFEIDYGDNLPRGRLLYVKPGRRLKRPLPVEVLNYANESPTFPHESTADQFFTEAQMEAYRLLGRACMEEALSEALAVSSAPATDPDRDPALVIMLRRLWVSKAAAPTAGVLFEGFSARPSARR
ncbi:MAG: patatin-like phospholipase family protein [Aquabacterium sp.]|nr:patatin-like phospholipase family protein [Aquabacterium sp.]